MISHLYHLGEDQRLYVPYRAGSGSHTSNIGFVDLKGKPERITEIHELRGYPEFEELIRALNASESSIRTLRVDTAKDEFPRPDYANSFFSMVTCAFEKAGPEDRQYISELYKYFVGYASDSGLPDTVQADFFIVPLTITAGNFSGWCFEIRLYGYGRSESEAKEAWSNGFRVMKDFLLQVDRQNRDF